jgi:hypothetical protein
MSASRLHAFRHGHDVLEAVRKSFEAGQAQAACALVAAYRSSAGADAATLARLARALNKARLYAQACATAEHAIALDGNPEVLADYAGYLVNERRYGEARRIYEAMDLDAVQEPATFASYASCLFLSGDLGRASELLGEAMGRWPANELLLRASEKLTRAGGEDWRTPSQQKRLFVQRWGEQHLDLQQALAMLRGRDYGEAISPGHLDWMFELSGRPHSEREEWQEGALWGRVSDRFLLDLLRSGYPGTRGQFRDLDRVFAAMVDPPDWRPVTGALSAGDGALIVGAHIGAFRLCTHHLNHGSLPVMNSGAARAQHTFTLSENPGSTLVHMVKSLRASRKALTMVADGPFGEGTYPVRIGRRTVRLALGPAVVAQNAKCRTFWGYASWKQGRAVVRLVEGPRYRAGQPRDAWFAEWFGFYGSCLRPRSGGSRRTSGSSMGSS